MSNICKTVTLRTRKIKKGTQLSFYLDYYPGYRDESTMKVQRHESLGIYIFAKPRNQRERDYNERMTEKAEALRCRRYESIVNERYDFFDREKMKGDFLAYFKQKADKKNCKWQHVYKHFARFCNDKYQFTWDDFVKISFSHHIEILTRSKDIAERLFYIHCAAQNAWSLSSLKNYLKEDIYSNRGSLPSNFLQVLPEAIYAVKATLAFKDEYMLEMVNLENVGEREQDWNEKVIENQIVTNIKQFILRFGNDFTFIDSQHRLIVAGEEMFADLVFFNRELNASVIVELKRGKFRPNYLGQLSGYLTVYDMTDKKPHENPSIGIVLCQDANRQFVEIMVRDYDKPMGVATYRTAQEMPENLRKTLPDIDKLQNLLSENDSKSETVR